MELFNLVRPTPQKEVEHKYSAEEEAKILKLLAKGGFIEDIAAAMNREVNSYVVRFYPLAVLIQILKCLNSVMLSLRRQ